MGTFGGLLAGLAIGFVGGMIVHNCPPHQTYNTVTYTPHVEVEQPTKDKGFVYTRIGEK